MTKELDSQWMTRALALAGKGRGWVEPNPLVGAVVVHENQVVGEGWHERFGEAHAEVNALLQAKEAARGATLYVTLEPCCHFGKTPPCTEAIIRSGITRVVAAMEDPFPKVRGRGVDLLTKAKISVTVGVAEVEARRINAPYLKLLKTGQSYVHAKWAMTLDGKIASRSGNSRWISNEFSRQRVHLLRGRMDAIVVGIGTVLADDPHLTARPAGPRTPTRVVLDRQSRLPANSRLATTARETPVLVVTTGSDETPEKDNLRKLGCEVLSMSESTESQGAFLNDFLRVLGQRRMTNILVEGGSTVLGSFLDSRALDEVHVFIAPLLLGGTAAKSPIGGTGFDPMANALAIMDFETENVKGDILFHGRLNRS